MYLAVVRAWYQSGTKPSRARAMVGASTSRNSIVPHRARASVRPATDPGTATERGPKALRSPRTRGQAKRAVDIPSPSGNISALAASGAHPLKSRARASPLRVRWTNMVPDPPSVLMKGSTTVIANAVATAASTALPPAMRIVAPTSAPSGCSAVTIPRGARGVRLVTTRRDRITTVSSADATRPRPVVLSRRVKLREVDHALVVVEVHGPSEGIRPCHPGARLDVGPVLPRLPGHAGGVRGLGQRRTEQNHHLLSTHAHRHPPIEPKHRDLQRTGILGMVGEIACDARLEIVVEVPSLVEARRPPGLRLHAPRPQLVGRGPLGGALLDGLLHRTADQQGHHDRDQHPPRAHSPMIDQTPAGDPGARSDERAWRP